MVEDESGGVLSGGYISIVLVVVVILLTLYLMYRWSTSQFGMFKKLGLVEAHSYPLIGSLMPALKEGMIASDLKMCEQYGRVFGGFEGSKPILFIADPDILREIFVKQFDNFPNRRKQSGFSELLNQGVSNARDEQWKRIRSTLSPSFSVSKLKHMLPLVDDCAESMLKHYDVLYEKKEEADIMELYSCFSMDVISRTTFSTKLDSYSDMDSPILRNGKKMFDFKFTDLKIIALLIAPRLSTLLSKFNMGPFSEQVIFFSEVIQNVLKNRHEEDEDSTDMLQQMLDSHEHIMKQHRALNKPGLTMDEVVAQCVLYLIAAYETTAQAVTLAAYHLALNPEMQERLCQEIDSVLESHDGAITYESLADMKYMEMVMNETMRINPAVVRTERHCVNDCVIKNVPIKAGWLVTIPMYAIHHDKQYWEDPEVFNPERFSPSNKANINPYAFLPFGLGPRQCLAMRLAQVEVKLALAKILHRYKYEIGDKMEMPIKIKKASFGSPAAPVYMKLIKR